MPIIIPKNLPAYKLLQKENIFIMNKYRASHQDIRPLKIIILNLMPNKIETETQLLRLIGNTPLQLEITLLNTATYQSKNTSKDHLESFYKTFSDLKIHSYDGLIITGAPVETMKFEDVDYWNELTEIMDFAKKHVTSTLHICWGAQAGLYYYYGIEKVALDKKLSGIYKHNITDEKDQLLRGFDEEFYAPHSRYTTVLKEDIEKIDELEILSESEEAGIYIVASKDRKNIFVSGHSEYDKNTLKNEYERDIEKGLEIDVPENYFKDNDPKKEPIVRWKSNAHLLFSNWLNYCVYQNTPFDLKEMIKKEI